MKGKWLVATASALALAGCPPAADLLLRVEALVEGPPAPGSLDASFGGDGVVMTQVGAYDVANAVATQADGKILLAGSASNGTDDDFAVVRYNTDGTLDTSFDGDGKVMTSVGTGFDAAQAIAIQFDGKIVVAGQSESGAVSVVSLVRYNTNGSLDTTFDGDGKVMTAVGTGSSEASAITIDSNSRIVIGGISHSGPNALFTALRYTTAGALDTTFDGDGIVTTTVGSGAAFSTSVDIQYGNKIVLMGRASNGTDNDYAAARYDLSNGALDATFDGDGKATVASAGPDTAIAGLVQPDSRILMCGYSFKGSTEDFSLTRFNGNGSLDTSFGVAGTVMTTVGTGGDYAYALALQDDGRIVVVGWTGDTFDTAMVRYEADGSLDASFGSGGKVFTPVGTGNSYHRAVAIQADGKIVVAVEAENASGHLFTVARYNP